jgi:LAGLIDADG DNA endonuclease family
MLHLSYNGSGLTMCRMKAIECPVTADELRRLYVEEKLTDQEIVVRVGCEATVKRVRSWRRRYGVGTINRTERHDVPPIEGNLQSLLIGSMLGDGRLAYGVHTTRYAENHAAFQSEYAEWKRLQWGAWVKHELKPVLWKKSNGCYPGVRFETVSHMSLNVWEELFYNDKGPKLLKPEVLPLVDPFALTVWYMDDGCAEWWPTITMATSVRDVALTILRKFDLTPEWKFSTTRDTTGSYVIRGEDNAHKFIDLVRPHIPECMSYKLEFGFQGAHYQVRQNASEEKLAELAAKGVPIREMARILGVGASTVDRYLREFGLYHPRKVGRPSLTLGR